MRRNPLFRFRSDLVSVWLGAALLLVVLAPVTLPGQTGYGTILGRVTDQSGAVVPNAKVTLRNEATNVSNVTQTNGAGEYVFPNLIPGAYAATVSQQGFNLFTVSHIVLSVSQTVRQDAQLTVGTTATTVNVTANAPLVQTDTSSVEGVIDSKQIETMPLDGRTNIFNLIALAPGVQGGAWGMYTPKFAGNNVEGSYNVRIDGTDASESENEYIGIGDPSLDAIAEFKVIDTMGSAKYGTGAASVIIVTKSGTNQFHGSAFEYNRIKELAAQNFFATGLRKSPYIRNEFGGSVGGPIIKDKLFFFGSFEGLTFRSSSTNEDAMPTAALLEGNFSGLPAITDPSTGLPFPGNQIPTNRFSSPSQYFLKFFDTPNLPSSAPGGLGTNFVVNLRSVQDEFRYEGRGDYTINNKNQLSVMWFDARYVPRVYPGFSPKFGGVTNPATYQNVAINYTRTITPSMTNLATFGFHRVWDRVAAQTAGQVDMSKLFSQMPAPLPGLGGLPNVSINGFNGLYDTGGGGDNEQTFEFSDTLTWAKGKHLIEAGFSAMHWKFYNYGVDDNGSFTFTSRYTGNAFADFLLGDLSASNYAVLPVAATPVNNRFGFFITDDWKPTSKLTLNLGLRYDLPTIYQNSPGNMSNFYPNLDELVVLKGRGRPDLFPGIPIVSGSSVGLNPGNYIGADRKLIAPRFGLAYRPLGSSRLILRGGYGLYYVSIPWVWGSYQLVRNAPFTAELGFEPAGGTTPTLTFADPFPTGEGTNSAASAPSANALPTHYRYPSTHQWNLTVESQITPNTSVRASYIGNESEHVTQQFNLNDPVPSAGPVQPNRPYQPFGPIDLWENGTTASTQQLQLSVRRRFTSGLSFEGEFSWTKMLDTGSYPAGSIPTDNRNIRYDRGNDSYVRPKYFVGNYTYELPFGKGRHYLASASRSLDAIVGGWQTSGILTIGSGLPFSVNFDSSVEGWPSNRADIVGNPHVSNPSLAQWFNRAAFALPAQFAYGNTAPNFLFGPGYFDWDTGIFKKFSLNERFKLTFRADLMNVLNHPNFGNPNNDISNPSQLGTITWAPYSPRAVQFSLRLAF
jgi:hypothetical protein